MTDVNYPCPTCHGTGYGREYLERIGGKLIVTYDECQRCCGCDDDAFMADVRKSIAELEAGELVDWEVVKEQLGL